MGLRDLYHKGMAGAKELVGDAAESVTGIKAAIDRKRTSEKRRVSESGDSEFAETEDLSFYDDIDIASGKKKEFRNSDIHFHAEISCAGTLSFEDCILHCGEDADGGITLVDKGKLILQNCKVVGHKNCDDKLIRMKAGTSLAVEECEFSNVRYFLHGDGSVEVKNCKFADCINLTDVIVGDKGSVSFVDCQFSFQKKLSGDLEDHIVATAKSVSFFGCSFTGRLKLAEYIAMLPTQVTEEDMEEFEEKYQSDFETKYVGYAVSLVRAESCKLAKCSLSGVNIGDPDKIIMQGCTFSNSALELMDGYFSESSGTFINCEFEECMLVWNDNVDAADCQFVECIVPEGEEDSCQYKDCKYIDPACF